VLSGGVYSVSSRESANKTSFFQAAFPLPYPYCPGRSASLRRTVTLDGNAEDKVDLLGGRIQSFREFSLVRRLSAAQPIRSQKTPKTHQPGEALFHGITPLVSVDVGETVRACYRRRDRWRESANIKLVPSLLPLLRVYPVSPVCEGPPT